MQCAGIVVPSMICGFGVLSHIILLIVASLPLVFIIKKHGIKESKTIILNRSKDSQMGNKIFLFF